METLLLSLEKGARKLRSPARWLRERASKNGRGIKPALRRSLQREFTRLSGNYTRLALARTRREAHEIAAWIQPQSHERVLDAAAGPGRLGPVLAPRVAHVFALDLCSRMLQKARELKEPPGPRLSLTVGDVASLPYRSHSFDLLTCSYAFANFQDPLAVLHEYARVIRGDGRIVVIDLIAPEDRAQRRCLNRLEGGRGNLYTRVLSRSEFMELFAHSGLRITAACSRLRRCRFRDWLRLSPAALRDPVHARRLRRMLVDSIEGDKAGLRPRLAGGEIIFYHRTAWFMLRPSHARRPKRPLARLARNVFASLL